MLHRILSWNVNGIRAVEKRGFLNWVSREKPDILAVQETKAQPDQLSDELRDPQGYLPQSSPLADTATLPILLAKTRLHFGIILGILAAIILYIIFQKTTLGYQMRVVGHNPLAGKYGGMNVERIILIAMILSGGLAGIAGMGEIAGVHHRLLENISPGYGYTAIVIALLSYLHPVFVIFVSILFAGLMVGADSMQRMAGLPAALVFVVQGLIVLFVLGSEYFVKRELQRLQQET